MVLSVFVELCNFFFFLVVRVVVVSQKTRNYEYRRIFPPQVMSAGNHRGVIPGILMSVVVARKTEAILGLFNLRVCVFACL